jgi:hypothetical protein
MPANCCKLGIVCGFALPEIDDWAKNALYGDVSIGVFAPQIKFGLIIDGLHGFHPTIEHSDFTPAWAL